MIRAWTSFTLLSIAACASAPPPPPVPSGPARTATVASFTSTVPAPIARAVPVERVLHGDRFVDEYFWLRKKGDPEVEAYLRGEDAYARSVLAPSRGLTETLYQEIVGHIQEDDDSLPYRSGNAWYWTRLRAGKEYPTLLRAKSVGGAEELVLDVNALAAGKKFMAVDVKVVSDDGKRLAYSTDELGFREFTLRVRDLASQKDLPDRIEHVTSAAWAADGKTLLYTVEDDAKRPYRVNRHRLGSNVAKDEQLFEETDGRFELSLERSRSHAFVVVTSESKLATEVRVLDAKTPGAKLRLIEPRRDKVKYFVEHQGKRFLIRVNDTGINYRLVEASLADPRSARWKEVRAHDPAVMLEAHDGFEGFYVLTTRRAGLPALEVVDEKSGTGELIAMSEADYDVRLRFNEEYRTELVRYQYQSLSTPPTLYDYSVKTKQSVLGRQDPVPGFVPGAYESERVMAKASDGVPIPISLVRKKGTPKDGKAPLLLHGYGSYGISYNPTFRADNLVLLDRGVQIAIAHIRGGGEGGKAWHEAGRMLNKRNTFSDFISAAEALISGHYTSRERLAIEGRSAGGLLMGAVLNSRPDLCKAAIVGVPFVDVVNTMNDASLPMTITEYEEWGNPNLADEYKYIRSYSPYDNLQRATYPAILVRSAYHDSQVMYWEPAKYVARMRQLHQGGAPLIFRIEMEPAGHGGKSGRYEKFRAVAEDDAFVLWQTGAAQKR